MYSAVEYFAWLSFVRMIVLQAEADHRLNSLSIEGTFAKFDLNQNFISIYLVQVVVAEIQNRLVKSG